MKSWDTPGTYSFTVPAGVTELIITAVAGGGAGSSGHCYYNNTFYRNMGADGGNTVIGSLLTLVGGKASTIISTNSLGSNGGLAGGSKGQAGMNAYEAYAIGLYMPADGGDSVLASGGRGGTRGSAGSNGIFGSGGGGAGNYSNIPSNFSCMQGSGGGSGDGVFKKSYTVTPGQVISITVGAGGAASSASYCHAGGKGGDGYVLIEWFE